VANRDSGTVSVLSGSGNGMFAPRVDTPVGSQPIAIAIVELRTGKRDLVVVNFGDDTVSVLGNDGSGTFAARADYPTASGPISFTTTDVDGDGVADLVVACANARVLSVLPGNRDGSFRARIDRPTGARPLWVAADPRGDHQLDLITTRIAVDQFGVSTTTGMLAPMCGP
jgi:hypothetical protein